LRTENHIHIKKILTSSGQVAETVRESIVSGRLAPGTKLREIELSAMLGVSRSPIREALRMLESEGLVQISPNRGAFVTQLEEKDLEEIHGLRELLEVYAIRMACEKIAAKDMRELETIMKETEESLDSDDYLAYLKTSQQIHDFFVQRCDNGRLRNLYKNIWNITLAIAALGKTRSPDRRASLAEHKKIVKALLQKDADKAEKYLREHLRCGYERTTRLLKQKK
jgi:DNA-binding GntR family transcriptional regulator